MKTESPHGAEGPPISQPFSIGPHMLEGISLEPGAQIELLSNEQGVPQVLIHSRSGITVIKSLGGIASPDLENLLALSRIVMVQDQEAHRDRRGRNDYDRRGPAYINRRERHRRQNHENRRRENVGRG